MSHTHSTTARARQTRPSAPSSLGCSGGRLGHATDKRAPLTDYAGLSRLGSGAQWSGACVPDVYASITEAEPAVVEGLVDILELRASDPKQREMREAYFADIDFPPDARVAEIGCGPGPVARALASRPGVGTVVGVDPSPIFLAKGRELDPRSLESLLRRGRCTSAAAGDESLDTAVFHTTLCHIPGPELALAEAARVLGKGDYSRSSTAIMRRQHALAATSTRSSRAPKPVSSTWSTTAGSSAACPGSCVLQASSSSAFGVTAIWKPRPRAAICSQSSIAVLMRWLRAGASRARRPTRSRPRLAGGQTPASSSDTSRMPASSRGSPPLLEVVGCRCRG